MLYINSAAGSKSVHAASVLKAEMAGEAAPQKADTLSEHIQIIPALPPEE